jgi:hypothetical protein
MENRLRLRPLRNKTKTEQNHYEVMKKPNSQPIVGVVMDWSLNSNVSITQILYCDNSQGDDLQTQLLHSSYQLYKESFKDHMYMKLTYIYISKQIIMT